MKSCGICSNPISKKNRSGKCISCAAKTRGPAVNLMPKVGSCIDCGNGITATSKTGRCRHCAAVHFNTGPGISEKRSRQWQKAFERDPSLRERMARQVQRNHSVAMTDPAKRQAAIERAMRVYETHLKSPETIAKIMASRKQAGQKIRNYRLAWCPEELRDRYSYLVNSKKMRAVDAKAAILLEWDEMRAARHPYFSDVIHFMRRFTSVTDRIGQGDAGKRYRVGLVDVSPGELLKRAEAKGYVYPQSDRLAA